MVVALPIALGWHCLRHGGRGRSLRGDSGRLLRLGVRRHAGAHTLEALGVLAHLPEDRVADNLDDARRVAGRILSAGS